MLKSTGRIVTRNIAIVIFVISAIFVSVYLLVHFSQKNAYENESVPQIFGVKYVTVNNADVVNSQTSYGSLVILEDIENSSDVGKGSVIVFKTTSLSSRNTVFGKYGMGVIKSVDTTASSTMYNVVSGNSTITVSSSVADSYAVRSVENLGKLVDYIAATKGFILFFIIPCCLFALSLILYIIFLVTDIAGFKKYEKELDTQDYEYMKPDGKNDDNMDIINIQKQIYQSVTYDDGDLDKLPEIQGETVSTLNVNYVASELLNLADIQQSDNTEKEDNQTKLWNSEEGISENINLNIKDDTIEFKFDNINSDKVEIVPGKDGSGFTIKTPEYKAKIKVEIKKK